MRGLIICCLLFSIIHLHFSSAGVPAYKVNRNNLSGKETINDSLPAILPGNHADLFKNNLQNEARLRFAAHRLPGDKNEWEAYRETLKRKLMEKAGITAIDHQLPLLVEETGVLEMKGYKIKNIAYQSRPGIFVTANLYVPDGNGIFPAVILMMGHSNNGRFYNNYQSVAHSLALNGYVCLAVDPWGAGERTTDHGKFEYHGGVLGASLMNIGQTLLGLQVIDNMRGVDLLRSLPYVDAKNIGATGASGGGNQTMWLTAFDERIKAGMPVVSVGTFESYVMCSNCICELLPGGLTVSEEAAVLALVAPRALKMCNHKKDSNPAFYPAEMTRSFNNALPVFTMYGAGKNISYTFFDLPHGYMKEDRETALGWFDLHLKGIGDGSPKMEIPFELVPQEKLMTYAAGKRSASFIGTEAYCKQEGERLRVAFLDNKTFDPAIKKKELRDALSITEFPALGKIHAYGKTDGWDKLVLETADKRLIPVLHRAPTNQSQEYVIISHPLGKQHIAESALNDVKKKGAGIVIADLSGTGETLSGAENVKEKSMTYHMQSRAELWLGKTLMGEWVKDLNTVADFVKTTYKAKRIGLDGSGETALAALFLSALEGKGDYLVLREAPVSYLFDNRASVDFYSMAIHLPGFLKWGDVSLAAALSGKNITMINPLTMSGRPVSKEQLKEYRTEFDNTRYKSRRPGKTIFMEERR